MEKFTRAFTNLFALWTVLGCLWAWFIPDHFTWFKPHIAPGLGVIMLGMGITLSFSDFRQVVRIPRAVAIGVGAQFLVMPLLGVSLAFLFRLDSELAVGLILVSCCPGGTASNVVTYLAGASLPLSVLMTMCSTFLAIGLTPGLTKILAGTYLPVDAWALFKTTVMVVLVPVLAGLLLNQFARRLVRHVRVFSPIVSVLVIILIVGCIIGLQKEKIIEHAGVLLLAVFLLHVGGFALGYLGAKVARLPVDFRRTISIEVGMQNSGLGATLAGKHFSPLAAVPSVISAVYHCIIGSILAGYWRTRPDAEAEPAQSPKVPLAVD